MNSPAHPIIQQDTLTTTLLVAYGISVEFYGAIVWASAGGLEIGEKFSDHSGDRAAALKSAVLKLVEKIGKSGATYDRR